MTNDWLTAQNQYEELIVRQNEKPFLTFRVGTDHIDEVAEWAGAYCKDWTMWVNRAHDVSYYPHGGSCWYKGHAIIQISPADYFMFYFVFSEELLAGRREMFGKHNVDTVAYDGIEFLADPELYDLHPVGYSDQEAMTDYPPIEEQFTPDWIEAQTNFDAGLGY